MLVLSRHANEQIVINDDIIVTVVGIRGDKVRLGIDAPSSVPVYRREIYDTIQQQKAAQTTDEAVRNAAPAKEGFSQ